tara:strand:+ start:554 stop:727 length:174 start_codon:yes stop_codon:yes gene_type:complete
MSKNIDLGNPSKGSNFITDFSQQRELLIAYELDTNKTCTQSMAEAIVDKYLKELVVA